jgi:hypothetical protein
MSSSGGNESVQRFLYCCGGLGLRWSRVDAIGLGGGVLGGVVDRVQGYGRCCRWRAGLVASRSLTVKVRSIWSEARSVRCTIAQGRGGDGLDVQCRAAKRAVRGWRRRARAGTWSRSGRAGRPDGMSLTWVGGGARSRFEGTDSGN